MCINNYRVHICVSQGQEILKDAGFASLQELQAECDKLQTFVNNWSGSKKAAKVKRATKELAFHQTTLRQYNEAVAQSEASYKVCTKTTHDDYAPGSSCDQFI